RLHFKGMLMPNLKFNMLDNSETNIFSSYEIAVYDGDKLVAFSFFDVGKSSLASIKGVYDHEYAKHSLGLYTMLKEIQFGLELGFQYFYPGYIVPGYPRFDYKLRVGGQEELEFFNVKSGGWQPFTSFSRENIPIHQLSNRLTEMGWALSDFAITSQIMFYPAYEANIFGYADERFLESPLFLNLYCNVFPRPRFIIFYDLHKEKYVFCHCMPVEDLGFYFQHAMHFDMLAARHFLDFILKKSLIAETEDIQEILRYAVHIGSLIKPQKYLGILK
ncbi:MAG: GNAT family N-acetyltransferase, partial [Bacteroidota bacterium]